MVFGLTGNSGLITASGSGLGKASAKALVSEGTNVVVNGRDENRLSIVVAEIRDTGAGGVIPFQGGTIVNITSMTVKEAADALVSSNSIWMSVIRLMKTVSKELALEARANAVMPGAIEPARIVVIGDSYGTKRPAGGIW